jgi:hypothetical protein
VAARIVCDLVQMRVCLIDEPNCSRVLRGGDVRQQHLDLALGRDHVGSRDPRVCPGISWPPKTPLYDVEPERGED